AAKKASPGPSPVAKKIPAPAVSGSVPNTPKSHLDRLKESSGLTDPIEILIHESNAKRHSSVLRLFDELPHTLAADINARLLKLRALVALNRTADIARFLQEQTIDDGEFYLLKARFLLGKGDIRQSLQIIEKSVTVNARQRDARMMRRDYLYYRATGLGLLYQQSPDAERKKEALDGWFEVKQSLRNYPDHAYFRTAVSEMQKIGSGITPTKG
ncbi:MAG: hypothetical protein JXA71_01745, partial [Chitinispirillaceae bacterium]|nr:hypothetical protein [Chitinispirillaceae bacterium]